MVYHPVQGGVAILLGMLIATKTGLSSGMWAFDLCAPLPTFYLEDCIRPLQNGNSEGVGWSNLKDHPWRWGGDMNIFWNDTMIIK